MTFNTCIKTGVRFQLDGDPEKTYSGDLFWDVARSEFLIRGIPRLESGEMASFRGPADLRLREVLEAGTWEDTGHAYVRFRKALVGSGLMSHITEWYSGDFPQMHQAITEDWAYAKLIA